MTDEAIKPAQKGLWTNRTSDKKDGDFFPTEPKFTELLLKAVIYPDGDFWEPACGDGAISKVLEAVTGRKVVSTDLNDHGYGQVGVDFLKTTKLEAPNIVTNPPFGILDDFVEHAVSLGPKSMTLLTSLTYLGSSIQRYFRVWKKYPPNRVILVVEKQKVLGKQSMFSHVWLHWTWDEDHKGTSFEWVTAKVPKPC